MVENNNILIKNNINYSLKTEEGRKNLMEFIDLYNKQDQNDVLFKKIGIDEALALTNIEEFIKTKSQVAEIIREAIEIACTTSNFKTNMIFTFTRNKLKKAGYNSIIRMQIENYIKIRLHLTDKAINSNNIELKYKNITTIKIGNDITYFNLATGEDLTENEIKEYLNYKKQQQLIA